jgi:hypothetical protein
MKRAVSRTSYDSGRFRPSRLFRTRYVVPLIRYQLDGVFELSPERPDTPVAGHLGTKYRKPNTEPKVQKPNRKYRNRNFRYPIRFPIPRNQIYRGIFGSLPRFTEFTEFTEMCWFWVLLCWWLYYCRLLYYVIVVLYSYSLVDFYLCVFGTIILYGIMKNYVKNGFWNCNYMSLWSVRYFSVNTGTEPNLPKPNFLGTDFSKEPIGTCFLRNRIYRGTEVPNRSVR